MVRIVPNRGHIESLSFSFNLNSEGQIRTSRDLNWVEESPLNVAASLLFGYKHYPENSMNQSDWELQLMIDDVLLDFRHDRFVVDGTEYDKPWPFNLVLFRMTSTQFLIHGIYKPPLRMCYCANDIIVFKCEFEHSLVEVREMINRFRQFNWNQSGKIPFDILIREN